MAGNDVKKLAPRGTPKQTELAHELGLHEYVWPQLLGESRAKWEAVAEFIERAAIDAHKLCGGSPDGHTHVKAPAFMGEHAASHKHRLQMAMVHLINAGIPAFLTEKS